MPSLQRPVHRPSRAAAMRAEAPPLAPKGAFPAKPPSAQHGANSPPFAAAAARSRQCSQPERTGQVPELARNPLIRHCALAPQPNRPPARQKPQRRRRLGSQTPSLQRECWPRCHPPGPLVPARSSRQADSAPGHHQSRARRPHPSRRGVQLVHLPEPRPRDKTNGLSTHIASGLVAPRLLTPNS